MSEKRIKLLVISDSHGRADRVRELAARQRDAEAILFLGDGVRDLDIIDPVPSRAICAVKGNCDMFPLFSNENNEFSEERSLIFGNYHILMMHGHTRGVKGGIENALLYAYSRGADILLFGHTHIPFEKYFPAGSVVDGVTLERPMYAFNPRSLGESSFGYIEIRKKDILFSHGRV
jgi:putative phosphoesterase